MSEDRQRDGTGRRSSNIGPCFVIVFIFSLLAFGAYLFPDIRAAVDYYDCLHDRQGQCN